MSTFSEFITLAEGLIENRSARTEPFLQAATVRWLKELSSVRALFMEDTFEFNTVVDQNEYGPGDTDFPVDAAMFQLVYRQEGTLAREIPGPMPLANVRQLLAAPDGISPGNPLMWAWHHDKMIFAPVPAAVITIKGDYTKDATRDEDSGALITTASTTHTNPWFERGEQALLHAVLWDYYSSIGKDTEAAALSRGLHLAAINTIRRDYQQKAAYSAQADFVWGSP